VRSQDPKLVALLKLLRTKKYKQGPMKKQAVNPICITMDGVSDKKKSATDLPVRMLTIKIKIANQRWAIDTEPVINK
jgi:hypothetical protein